MRKQIYIHKSLLCLFILFCKLDLYCQEQAIPFDSNGKYFSLNADQNKIVKLYQGEGYFKEAVLFSGNDSVFVLEILYEKSGKLFRERKNLTKNELVRLRQNVDNVLYESEKSEINQEGRGWLLAATSSSGLIFYAPSLPQALELSDRATMAVYMLTASSAFFLPYYFTKDEPVTYGQANLVYYGLSRGYIHGMLLSQVITKSPGSSLFFGTAFCTGIGEAYLGYSLTKKYNVGDGTANLISIYGDFGMLGGLAIANQFDLIDKDNQGTFGTLLLSGLTGMGLGYSLNKDNQISAGDGEIIRTTTYLGAYLPLGFFIEMESESSKGLTTTMFLTGAAGAYIGHKLVKDHDFDFMHGAIVELGTLAGGLGGLGIGYIINNESGSVICLSGAIGGIASFWAMYNYYSKRSVIADKRPTFELNFYPYNFYALKQKNLNPYLQSQFPLVSFSKRF